ncbi:MAG: outer membrane lipoprotein LolB [Piscirickettsiaceae bacterium]|nr:outer membrane lipoprotein LolB [Piscirickettsiaceae bacterium]
MKQLLLILLLLQSVACVPIWQQRPVSSPETLQQTRQLELQQLKQWQIKGRTVITQDKEGWNVGLIWQEYNDHYQIQLKGPFSQGGVTLNGNAEKATLIMNDGKTITSNDPEKLIYDVLKVQLPIYALRDWVRGIPHSNHEITSIDYDEKGRITQLIQQGWEINYLRYIPFKKLSMPAKIFIKRPNQSLRLIITRWKETSLEQSTAWKITP